MMPERIYGFRGEAFFLSNFFIEKDGLSAEAKFQSWKTFDPAWQRKILDAPTPAKAKYHGRSVPLRTDWEDVKLGVMRLVVQTKFSDPDLRARLLATGDADLIEANTWGDRTWGVDEKTGAGQNLLGQLLMETRTLLRTT
jgi:ribA/ribD-fused uncharacterized protein